MSEGRFIAVFVDGEYHTGIPMSEMRLSTFQVRRCFYKSPVSHDREIKVFVTDQPGLEEILNRE